jgi:4-amino-4-deoxy-L-arabinose transferase-like glycosyltransferase
LQAAWGDRDWPWGKLVLVWSLGYLLPISVMETKLPWYGLPLYPPLALAIGPLLGSLWEEPPARFGRSWQVIFGLLTLGGCAGAVYFSAWATPLEPMLALALAALGLTGGAVVLLAQQGDRQLIPVAFWGMFVGLTLFFSSGSWLWELNEQYPVRPVANLLRSVAHSGSKVYTSDRTQRPSLDFYCHCEVIPVPQSEQAKHWADRRVALWVIRPQDRDRPPFQAGILVGKAGDRLVIRRGE